MSGLLWRIYGYIECGWSRIWLVQYCSDGGTIDIFYFHIKHQQQKYSFSSNISMSISSRMYVKSPREKFSSSVMDPTGFVATPAPLHLWLVAFPWLHSLRSTQSVACQRSYVGLWDVVFPVNTQTSSGHSSLPVSLGSAKRTGWVATLQMQQPKRAVCLPGKLQLTICNQLILNYLWPTDLLR